MNTDPGAMPVVSIWMSKLAAGRPADSDCSSAQRILTGDPPRLEQMVGSTPAAAPAGKSNRTTASSTVSTSPFSTTTW